MKTALRILLIVAGTLAFLYALLLDSTELFIVPTWVFLLTEGAVLVGILRRLTLRRIMVAIVVLAVMIRLTLVNSDLVGHRLQRVRIGMTEAEVRAIFAGYTVGTGLVDPYTKVEFRPNGSLVFRNRRAEPGDSNWAIIRFTNGRVSGTEYSPD